MIDEILPCLFCIDNPEPVTRIVFEDQVFMRNTKVQVICTCGARGPFGDNVAQAIAGWNNVQDPRGKWARQGALDHKRGVYGKYHITKADGTPVDPDAQYFVLRLDTDIHARRAIMAYAESVEMENGELSSELRTWAVELEKATHIQPARCKWDFVDAQNEYYATGCGQKSYLMNGSVGEKIFCCYCGGKIEIEEKYR